MTIASAESIRKEREEYTKNDANKIIGTSVTVNRALTEHFIRGNLPWVEFIFTVHITEATTRSILELCTPCNEHTAIPSWATTEVLSSDICSSKDYVRVLPSIMEEHLVSAGYATSLAHYEHPERVIWIATMRETREVAYLRVINPVEQNETLKKAMNESSSTPAGVINRVAQIERECSVLGERNTWKYPNLDRKKRSRR